LEIIVDILVSLLFQSGARYNTKLITSMFVL